jgi:HD-GYP domain-containing protein (c-di-GMP phosphodiesterase class II)
MTADRAYRKALSVQAARAELRANAGSQFDPAVVDAFLAATDPDRADAPEAEARSGIDVATAHIRALLHAPVRAAADKLPV